MRFCCKAVSHLCEPRRYGRFVAPKATRAKATGAARNAATRHAATPWGQAEIVEELQLAQRAAERRFSSVVQLLVGAKGELLVRFAYSTDGSARRGPVTLRAQDVERLHKALRERPRLAAALGLDVGPGGDA